MTTTKRVGLAVAVVLLLAVAGGLYYFLQNLDSMVEDAIERYGSEATGTDVSVDAVEISLQTGKAIIRGLTVGNPEGFDEPHAFAWNEVSVDIDLESLRSAPPYVIESVRIDAPEVVMSVNELGRVNLLEIRDRLTAGAARTPEANDAPAGEEPRLRIGSFTFERGRTAVHTSDVGGEDLRVDLPALKLTGLGGSQGAPAAQIARDILSRYIEQVVTNVARDEAGRRIGRVLEDQLGEDGSDTVKAAKGLFDQLRGQ